MRFIKRTSGLPVLGILPFVPGLDVSSCKPGKLQSRFKIDLKPILKYREACAKKAEKARHIKDLDKSFVWHPFTQMRDWLNEDPLIIERGEGSYLFDTEGKSYLDGVSSIWVTTHGHRKREINQGIKAQLNKVAHSTMLGLGNVPAAELAGKLIEIAPKGIKKVFYSDCGSTAVEIALKMAFQYWMHREGADSKRKKFVFLNQSYHGDTLGAMGVGGIDLFHDLFRPLLFDSYKIPNPYCYRCSLNRSYPSCGLACADEAEAVVKSHSREIAALIIEPMAQGAGGVIVYPKGYLRKIADICRKHGILLIADEVATGFGRTGKMFACEHEGVEPDILCVSKGITGGYLPLAATLTGDEIFSAFLGDYKELKTFFHGHTYTGNPLACAAALENLKLFRKEKTLRKMRNKIEFIRKGLERFKGLEHVGEVRQMGFMVGIELVRDKAAKEPFAFEEKAGVRVIQEARRRGVIIRPLGNVVVMVPHLSFSLKELKTLLDVTYKSIQAVFK
ncbi:MAG: adenosylmethionine--8-amino-7-oxononanoate transaminase [Nitrospinae bacterium]|nr:adenosylmethionine--8-amino-7-oxononanoate transaminase [Nitrospinota bacterium]